MKKPLIVFLSGAVVCLLFFYFLGNSDHNILSPSYTVKSIEFDNGKKLYLKSKVWGISSDKKIIALSTDSTYVIKDAKKEYIYMQADFLFYQVKRDSLYLYVYNLSKQPLFFQSSVKIKQIQLENREMMGLFHNSDKAEIKKFE